MAEAATKLPIKTETVPATKPTKPADWQPFEALRNQVDRLFHDFQTGFLQAPSYRSLLDMEPFWRRDLGFNVTPAIDIVEKEKAFEITAELPGLDAKNIDLQLSDNVLTIKGEKQEEKEEKTGDRYVSERRYGSFRRSLEVPGSVDVDKIEANFKNGLLIVSMPKSPEAQKKQKTIPVSVK
jgi:HSP20 family protein